MAFQGKSEDTGAGGNAIGMPWNRRTGAMYTLKAASQVSIVLKRMDKYPYQYAPGDDISDRGEAKYFHGREDHRDKFSKVLTTAARTDRGGTVVVFQGPPGVGKTALLGQLEEDAKRAGWQVVHIKPAALESPAAMVQAIGGDYVEHRGKELAADGDVGLDVAGVLKAGAGGRMSTLKTIAGTQTVSRALRDALTADAKLVLILDEAQHLAEPSSRAAGISIRDTLNDIVNGRTGRRVVLLLGGLSHTWTAMRARGVSRLRQGCNRHLARVQDETAGNILRDWLTDVGCKDEHREDWVAALLPVADNWPQHLMCCIVAAAEHFNAHGSEPTPPSLAAVIQAVHRAKSEFYNQRAQGIPGHSLAAVGMLVGAWGLQKSYTSKTLLSVLSIDAHAPDTMTPRQCCEALVEQGVIVEVKAGKLRIPIPSMERYLMTHAISLAMDAPIVAQEYWREVCAIALATVGRIAPDLQNQIGPILASNRQLLTGMGGDDGGASG